MSSGRLKVGGAVAILNREAAVQTHACLGCSDYANRSPTRFILSPPRAVNRETGNRSLGFDPARPVSRRLWNTRQNFERIFHAEALPN